MIDQLPLFEEPEDRRERRRTAKTLRDEAVARVLANAGMEWNARALVMLHAFCLEREEFIAEDFRVWAFDRGLGKPHHHNAFGGFFSRIVPKQNCCAITGRTGHTRTLPSHARRALVWRSSIYHHSEAA